jgi:hypothetical protein
MGLIVIAAFVLLSIYGWSYYITDLDNRFFHIKNDLLKPSGLIGHGIGIAGSFFMLTGVLVYMARKRMRLFSRLGTLKHWLEFHIFLCTLGPVLVLFHTSFKFGGLVSVSFWSMVAVVASGVLGRFIYLQIPRTIEGREMSRNEIVRTKTDMLSQIESKLKNEPQLVSFLSEALNVKSTESKGNFFQKIGPQLKHEKRLLSEIRSKLKSVDIAQKECHEIMRMIKGEIVLSRRIAWLSTMQDYLRYWHVAHLPFALVMLFIMIIHVVVAVLFGYKWIF